MAGRIGLVVAGAAFAAFAVALALSRRRRDALPFPEPEHLRKTAKDWAEALEDERPELAPPFRAYQGTLVGRDPTVADARAFGAIVAALPVAQLSEWLRHSRERTLRWVRAAVGRADA